MQVPPGRRQRWLDGFARRHGEPDVTIVAGAVQLASPDGAVATIESPWGAVAGPDPVGDLVAQVTRTRLVGVLLVRRRGHAVGLAEGERLIAHRVGRHYVQGRTKAGGWSQQRYARRRDNQAGKAFERATRDAADLLLPVAGTLDAVLLGGDSVAVRTVLEEPVLAALKALAQPHRRRVLPVADPNLRVLTAALPQLLAVQIGLNTAAREPSSAPPQRDDESRKH